MKRGQRQDDHTAILRKAFRRLDPDNEMLPGSSAYKDAEAMILKWIRIHGPDQALIMVERSVSILKDVTTNPQEDASLSLSFKKP
jgi:hypothetical protein